VGKDSIRCGVEHCSGNTTVSTEVATVLRKGGHKQDIQANNAV